MFVKLNPDFDAKIFPCFYVFVFESQSKYGWLVGNNSSTAIYDCIRFNGSETIKKMTNGLQAYWCCLVQIKIPRKEDKEKMRIYDHLISLCFTITSFFNTNSFSVAEMDLHEE